MDPITLIGSVVALIIIFAVMIIEGGSPTSILLVAPLLLVFGGTIAVGAAGVSTRLWISSFKAAGKSLINKPPAYGQTLKDIISCAEIARREGLLALEERTAEIEDDLLRQGLELAIDGTDPADLQDILQSELHSRTVHSTREAKLFSDMGGYAPTIGIIGTILGLVTVLSQLDNPDELGHLIAAAFVAAMWGVLSANVFWLPLGNKMKLDSDLMAAQGEVVIEGILAIQAGANPRMVDQRLRALMPVEALKDLDDKVA